MLCCLFSWSLDCDFGFGSGLGSGVMRGGHKLGSGKRGLW